MTGEEFAGDLAAPVDLAMTAGLCARIDGSPRATSSARDSSDNATPSLRCIRPHLIRGEDAAFKKCLSNDGEGTIVTATPVRQSPELLRRLLRAKDRLDSASHEDWPVSRLARVSAVSEAHFARSFKQAFGIPPHRYLLTRRIERAMTLLRDTERPITTIAAETGWESLGTFGRIFRDVTGSTPSAIRAHGRVGSEALVSVPGCVVQAAERPQLTIAVSEKRRRSIDCTNGDSNETEVR